MSLQPPQRRLNGYYRFFQLPRTHVARRYMDWKFCKQYDRFIDHVQAVLLLRQPEIYINTIFFRNAVQFFITWKRADTQEMCHVTITLCHTADLAKAVTDCIAAFDNIVYEASTFGNSPYADLFI